MKSNKFIGIGLVIVLVAAGAYFLMRPDTQESQQAGELDEFAQCVYDSGMRMYGSATCSFCIRQKKLFGASSRLLGEIECDPRNPNSNAELCVEKNVSHTPTWILEDEDGNDIRRFDSGVLSLEELSEASGCPL